MSPVRSRRLAALLPAFAAVALVVAACGGSAATPAPSASPAPTAQPSPVGPEPTPGDPTPVIPTPSPNPEGQTYWLRITTTQALAPEYVFGNAPMLVITGDGLAVMAGAVPAIYPGPLVMPLFSRQVSEAGREKIVAWAKELGLLAGKTDFHGEPGTIGGGLPGGISGMIELTVDGERIALTGPMGIAAENPSPGSAEAFGTFWNRLMDLSGNLGAEVGPETPYTPAGYSVLIGPVSAEAAQLQQPMADWPLEVGPGSFGSPVAGGAFRCGTATGADAAALGQAFAKANQLTPWVEGPETSATFGLTVRQLTPGEDACREIFGG